MLHFAHFNQVLTFACAGYYTSTPFSIHILYRFCESFSTNAPRFLTSVFYVDHRGTTRMIRRCNTPNTNARGNADITAAAIKRPQFT